MCYHNLVYRFRNAPCIKRLISIGIITPLILEAIIVTMHALLNTIKASMHACFVFNSLIAFKFYYWFITFQLYILATFKQ